ncbi:MAG: Nif3-like dinuclear metal center hexameric protein [Chloroflexi bacterium]|nr:MAG: Nif3-like dinuclear metal center hexameric protein [Chloroflexota bacterium]
MLKKELVSYLDEYLRLAEFNDYGPQGLQVEAGHDDVQKIALAVDVAPSIIEQVADWGADMLLVHHGVLWRSVERIAGALGERVRLLMANDIHLYAAHLALDGHPEVGNNVVLAHLCGVTVTGFWCAPMGMPIGVYGSVTAVTTLTQFAANINTQLHTHARILAHGPTTVRNVAILSGFGADQVLAAKELGCDTLLTGETSHANYWAAADYGMNVIFAGHYATETVGVQALGQHLTDKFELETRFFDFPTQM